MTLALGLFCLAILSLLCSLKLRAAFAIYCFVFVPSFGLLLEMFSRINGQAPSVYVSAIKDCVWAAVFMGFVLRWLLWPKYLRISPIVIFLLAMHGILSVVGLSRGFYKIGELGVVLALRNHLGYLPAFPLVVYILRNRAHLHAIRRYVLYSLIVVGVIALIQALFGYESVYNSLRGRVDIAQNINSTFISYIELSLFCNVAIALIISLDKHFPNSKVMIIGLVLGIITVILSNSRMGLSVLLLLLLFKVLVFKRGRTQIIVSVLVAIGIVIFKTDILVCHRIVRESFATPRFVAWSGLLGDFWLSPLFGYGFGVYGPAAVKAFEMGATPLIKVYYVDSFFLSFLLNMGIIGFMLFLTLLVGVFFMTITTIRNSKDNLIKDTLQGALLALMILLLYSIVFPGIGGFPGNLYFYTLLGVIFAARNLIHIPDSKQNYLPLETQCRNGSVF